MHLKRKYTKEEALHTAVKTPCFHSYKIKFSSKVKRTDTKLKIAIKLNAYNIIYHRDFN